MNSEFSSHFAFHFYFIFFAFLQVSMNEWVWPFHIKKIEWAYAPTLFSGFTPFFQSYLWLLLNNVFLGLYSLWVIIIYSMQLWMWPWNGILVFFFFIYMFSQNSVVFSDYYYETEGIIHYKLSPHSCIQLKSFLFSFLECCTSVVWITWNLESFLKYESLGLRNMRPITLTSDIE